MSYESLNCEDNDGNMIEEKPMITKVDTSTNTEFCVIDCDRTTLLKQTRKSKQIFSEIPMFLKQSWWRRTSIKFLVQK